MVGIVDGAVVALYERHQNVGEIGIEVVASAHSAKATHTAESAAAALRLWLTLGLEQCGVTVGEYQDHLLGLALGDQVIKDKVHLTNLEVNLLGIGSTAYKVHHGVFLVLVLGIVIERRGIYYHGDVHIQSG